MKIIRELYEDVDYLEEDDGSGHKNAYIEGVFMQSNIRNKNGRVYPKAVLEGEVRRYCDEKIAKHTAYGELGHPLSPTINLSNASHLIVSLREDGNNFIGKARILPTPAGNIVRAIMSAGGRVGVSSRAMGTLVPRDDGAMEVQDDLRLSTAADIVADPSAPLAYVNGIMEEAEWTFDERFGWRVLETIEEQKKVLRACRKIDEQTATAAFKKFLSSLN